MLKEAYELGKMASLEKLSSIVIDPGIAGALSGLLGGYYSGRQTAETTANMLSSKGSKTKNESLARNLATVASPLGALGGMALGYRHKHRFSDMIRRMTQEPVLRELAQGMLPFGSGALGGMATGAGVGALTSLRGQKWGEKKASFNPEVFEKLLASNPKLRDVVANITSKAQGRTGLPVERIHEEMFNVLKPALKNKAPKMPGVGQEKLSSELTSKSRDALSDSDFVFPKERRYPIHDLRHARNALARVAQHGTSGEKTRVRAAVHQKYPEIGREKTSAYFMDKSAATRLKKHWADIAGQVYLNTKGLRPKDLALDNIQNYASSLNVSLPHPLQDLALALNRANNRNFNPELAEKLLKARESYLKGVDYSLGKHPRLPGGINEATKLHKQHHQGNYQQPDIEDIAGMFRPHRNLKLELPDFIGTRLSL